MSPKLHSCLFSFSQSHFSPSHTGSPEIASINAFYTNPFSGSASREPDLIQPLHYVRFLLSVLISWKNPSHWNRYHLALLRDLGQASYISGPTVPSLQDERTRLDGPQSPFQSWKLLIFPLAKNPFVEISKTVPPKWHLAWQFAPGRKIPGEYKLTVLPLSPSWLQGTPAETEAYWELVCATLWTEVFNSVWNVFRRKWYSWD